MTKQEEIREGIKNKIFTILGKDNVGRNERDLDEYARYVLSYLHSQGVVIKVDGELPPLGNTRVMFEPEEVTEWYRRGAQDYWEKVITAGFRFFEPLVDTGQKQGV